MRIPISWLKEYVDVTVSPQELADMLTIAGMEVDEVEYIGIPGGKDEDERLVWDRELLIIGQILQVEQHPNADKLVLATVEYGAEETETVVTGAPNIFQYIGKADLSDLNLFTPFALEGAIVYDGHKEGNVKMKLKGKALRGIHNRCMVCSAKELGLGEVPVRCRDVANHFDFTVRILCPQRVGCWLWVTHICGDDCVFLDTAFADIGQR